MSEDFDPHPPTEPECTCTELQRGTVCHDMRNEPHLVGCPRWGFRKLSEHRDEVAENPGAFTAKIQYGENLEITFTRLDVSLAKVLAELHDQASEAQIANPAYAHGMWDALESVQQATGVEAVWQL